MENNMKFLSSTTDTILVALTLALIAFTALHITDPKDFYAFVGMVASYKFGRSQAVTPPTPPAVG
jgi:hypothetical protein